jgi:glycolate oxidase FAD binding subunit
MLEPADTDAVCRAVRDAAASDATLRVAGAGTWLAAGRPVRATTRLGLRRLAGVVEYVPGDLTITLRAGTTFAEVEAITAEHGQWLALDPFGVPEATLGATVATGSSGPLAASFGTPRDVVLGLECVTGDGEIVHGGARVVKHVAGFDLVRLLAGAWGTLGIITQLTLRLRARAPVDATFAVPVDTAALGEWLVAYRAAALAPMACELIGAGLASTLGIAGGDVALLRIAGNDESVAAQEQALRALGAVTPVAHRVWAALAAGDPAEPVAALRLSHRVARLPDVWAQARRLAGLPEARVSATVERGTVRVVLPRASDAQLRAALDGVTCTRVFEVLPADSWPVLAPCAVGDPLSRRVRDAFDPERRLNRGIMGET